MRTRTLLAVGGVVVVALSCFQRCTPTTGADGTDPVLLDLLDRLPSFPAAFSGERLSLTVSPDGKRAAYFRAPATSSSDRRRQLALYVSEASEYQSIRLCEPDTWPSSASLAWAPDSRRLAFTSVNITSSVRLIDVETDSCTTLFEDREAFLSNPTWSPDGQVLAFLRQIKSMEGPPELLLARVDGTIDDRIVLPEASPDRYGDSSLHVSWAPASSKIAVLAGHSSWIFDSGSQTFDGPTTQKRAVALCAPKWSTDGAWVAWVAGPPGRVCALEIQSHQILEVKMNEYLPFIAWLPDSHSLLALKTRLVFRLRDFLDLLRSGGHSNEQYRLIPTLIRFPERDLTALGDYAWISDEKVPASISQESMSTVFATW